MKIKQIFFLLFFHILLGCKPQSSQPSVDIIDLTKPPVIDSLNLSPSHSKKNQDDYNEIKKGQFLGLLQKLNIKSLKEIPGDVFAYRLIVDFGWRNYWSGIPLSLSIYNTLDTAAYVETFELNPINRRDEYYNNSVWQHQRYKVRKENFIKLDSAIQDKGYWQDYSFENNTRGIYVIDGTTYFLELRKGTKYKLVVREYSPFDQSSELLANFLLATKYNDSIAYLIKAENRKRHQPTKPKAH